MINISKIDSGSVCLCTSCQNERRKTDLYEIKIGKTEQQTVTIRLCFDCLADFGNAAYEIYEENTDRIEFE